MDISISRDQAKDFALACFDEIMREIKTDLLNEKEKENQAANHKTNNT